MDLDTGEVIWAGKGRSKEDFKRFFEDMPKGYLSDVMAVAMDMNASYNILFSEKLPKAVIVYDRYHMQAPTTSSSPRSCRRQSSSMTATTCRPSMVKTSSALFAYRRPGSTRGKPRASSKQLNHWTIRNRGAG